MPGHCPFCHSTASYASYLPDTLFNGKLFKYVTCSNCKLIYVNPFPAADDYPLMYPATYQNGINPVITAPGKKLPGLRFSYDKHFDLINKLAPGPKILDYGCGQANFLINALAKGYPCDGVEYNPAHIHILKEKIAGADFFLIDDFLSRDDLKYDVIRLSNVLEHLDNPGLITAKLTEKLNPSGILLIEGPIETNFSLALLVRKIYFKLRSGKPASHPPTHIFFANAKNQRDFFTRAGLQELYFEVKENEWPFPETLEEARGAGGLFKFFMARLSIAASLLVRNWGNTFIYAGKRK